MLSLYLINDAIQPIHSLAKTLLYVRLVLDHLGVEALCQAIEQVLELAVNACCRLGNFILHPFRHVLHLRVHPLQHRVCRGTEGTDDRPSSSALGLHSPIRIASASASMLADGRVGVVITAPQARTQDDSMVAQPPGARAGRR